MKSFSRCCVDVIAESTERRLTRDLMFDAVPNSSASIFAAREIWSFGGRISEIIDVPLPRAASRDLISFLIFQTSICCSFFASSDCDESPIAPPAAEAAVAALHPPARGGGARKSARSSGGAA